MKEFKPSRTAQFVTLGRALADLGLSHIPGFSDPTARVFLNDKSRQALDKIERAKKTGVRSARYEMARGMADMLGLRTSAIDESVRSAIASGATQLVILGAGYDGRAWRMPELKDVKVFEVDHPATQSDKRARVAQLPTSNANVTFVPINFERESLNAVLQRAGHDASSPTCWIWEGVVMYLTMDAMRSTLRDIAKRSAPNSTLIVNYHAEHRSLIGKIMFWLIGEPQISAWTQEEMAADLKAAGFTVTCDSGMLDWNRLYANGEARVQRGAYMRVARAER